MAFGPYVVEFRLVQEELGIRGGGAQQKKAHPFVYELVHIGMYRQYTPSPASGGSCYSIILSATGANMICLRIWFPLYPASLDGS